MTRGLSEDSRLHRERRLVPGLAPESFDRVEDRGLFPADVRAAAAADLDVEGESCPHHVWAKEPPCARRVDRALEPLGGQGILSPHVDESLLAPGRERGDRHGLDDAERVALHDDAVLEGAGLGLVGVADEVVRPHRLPGDRVPLPSGGERRPAAAEELGVGDLADHPLGAKADRVPQCLVPAERPVRVQARRIGHVHPAEQLQRSVTGLREARVRRQARGQIAGEDFLRLRRVHFAEEPLHRLLAGNGDERGRCLVAEPQAGAPEPDGIVLTDFDLVTVGAVMGRVADRPLQLLAHLVGALAAAGDVVADVQHALGPGNGGQQRVEGDDAVGIRRGHRQALADVVERALADPADRRLDGLKRGQQQMAPGTRLVAAGRGMRVAPLVALAAVPPGRGRAEQRVYGFALLGRGYCVQKM